MFRDPENKSKTFRAVVTGVNRYEAPGALEKYLKGETLERALPGVKTIEEGMEKYLQWSTMEEIEKYGMLGIQVRPI